MTNKIAAKLKGGDLRSIGKSNKIVKDVAKNPDLFADLISGLLDDDRLVRMRAADAVEKTTRAHPELLQPWKRLVFDAASSQTDKELRWHMAQILPRLRLTLREQKRTMQILMEYLKDKSSIVRTFSMQALSDLALQDKLLLEQVLPVIERLAFNGTPAMKSRGRKLLKELKQQESKQAS